MKPNQAYSGGCEKNETDETIQGMIRLTAIPNNNTQAILNNCQRYHIS
jgi:hypothetical protein